MDDDEYLNDLMAKAEGSRIGHNSQHYLEEKERLFIDLVKQRNQITSKTIAEVKEIVRKGKLERLEFDVNVMGKALSELRYDPETGKRLSDENYGKVVSRSFSKVRDTKWFSYDYRASCVWGYENPDELKRAQDMFSKLTSIHTLMRNYRSWQIEQGTRVGPYQDLEEPEFEDLREKYYEEQLKKHEEQKRKAFEDAIAETLAGVKEGKVSPEEAAKAAWEKSEAKRKEIEENPQVVDLLAHVQSTKNFKVSVVSANFVASMEQLIHKFPEEQVYSHLSKSLAMDMINVKVPALHKMANILNSLCEEYQIKTPNMHH